MMQRVDVLGVAIDNVSMREALDWVVRIVENRSFTYAVTPTVDHVIKLRGDARFRQSYQGAQLVLTDGVPLLWASRLLGTPLKERINGTDLFERTCELAASRGYTVYLLGGNPGAAAHACRNLTERYPGLKIAGWDCPPHGFQKSAEHNRRIQRKILRARADILFVALGAPKQENWIYDYARDTGVAFAVGVGISFSFVAGEITRAPVWMQHGGLEWLWRLLNEPRRLWKRYLVDGAVFVYLLFHALIRRLLPAQPSPAKQSQ